MCYAAGDRDGGHCALRAGRRAARPPAAPRGQVSQLTNQNTASAHVTQYSSLIGQAAPARALLHPALPAPAGQPGGHLPPTGCARIEKYFVRTVKIYSPQYTRERSTKALAAVTALHQLHCVWRHGPRPWSLLLDQAMESAGAADTQVAVHYLHLPSPTLTSCASWGRPASGSPGRRAASSSPPRRTSPPSRSPSSRCTGTPRYHHYQNDHHYH